MKYYDPIPCRDNTNSIAARKGLPPYIDYETRDAITYEPLVSKPKSTMAILQYNYRVVCRSSLYLGPKALIFERHEEIITLGVMVAEELFNKSAAVVALKSEDFC